MDYVGRKINKNVLLNLGGRGERCLGIDVAKNVKDRGEN